MNFGIAPRANFKSNLNNNSAAPLPTYEEYKRTTPAMKIKQISKRYGAEYYLALGKLYTHLTGKNLDPKKILNVIELLSKLKNDLTKQYLYSLLFPEKHKNARIPTKFPTPSSTFQQNDFLLVTTNASGHFCIQWCPQNLSSTIANNEFVVNNNSTLGGNTADVNYVTSTTLVNTLNTQWQAFRVVSACMIIQYVGSFTDMKGLLGGGVDITTSNTNSFDSNYSVFSNIDDRLWSSVVRADEGLKVCYFPKDYADLNFIKPQTTPAANGLASAVRLLAYGQGLPPSTQCIRIDLIKNVEAIPGPAFADIMEVGYLDCDSGNEVSFDAAKLMTKNNLIVTKMDEQEMLEKLMKTPGKDYISILQDERMKDIKVRNDFLKDNLDKIVTSNSFMDSSVLDSTMDLSDTSSVYGLGI